jgi:predicted deacylase
VAKANTKTIEIGTARAEPGAVARGAMKVTELPAGGSLEIPVIVINGVNEGPCFWVDGSIHGDEPEGPFTCQKLAREIKPETLSGTLVLVPAMNPPAYEAGQRGNPLDTFSYDMNRIYPGRADGYLTERVAWVHSQWMRKFADLEISIHSGGAHSYLAETIFINEDPASDELAKAMGRGWDLVLSAISPKGNPMATMLEAGKPGITVELGGRSATSPEAMRRVVETLTEAARNIMRHYGMIDGKPHYAEHRGAIRARAGRRVRQVYEEGRPDRRHRRHLGRHARRTRGTRRRPHLRAARTAQRHDRRMVLLLRQDQRPA